MEGMVERLLEMMIQTNINDILAVYKEIPNEFRFTFYVAMRVILDSMLPSLSDHDRELYDGIVQASETIVIHMPRREEDPE